MLHLGNFLNLTSFGESHGAGYGGILSNFPAGVTIDEAKVQETLDRRKPGQSNLTTPRKENDRIKFLSGIFEGKSTGAPIAFFVENTNTKSQDYSNVADKFRPSHADFTYEQKYGIRDYRGGGRSSARETLNWVVAGSLAQLLLPPELEILSYVSQIGRIRVQNTENEHLIQSKNIESSPVRCPFPDVAVSMEEEILSAKKRGDSVGGVISTLVKNVPIGLGEPVFGKLHAALGHAMLSINACHGFEYGSGFAAAAMYGSQHNDEFNPDFTTKTNHSGGIQGGISNGMDIEFRTAFKPVASISVQQNLVSSSGDVAQDRIKGRHDPCVVPRAVPIVDSLTAFVLADFYLINKLRKC